MHNIIYMSAELCFRQLKNLFGILHRQPRRKPHGNNKPFFLGQNLQLLRKWISIGCKEPQPALQSVIQIGSKAETDLRLIFQMIVFMYTGYADLCDELFRSIRIHKDEIGCVVQVVNTL